MSSLYKELVENNVPISNYCSDLYFEANEVSAAIAAKYSNATITTFIDSVTKNRWYCAYFMYEPYWESRNKQDN